MDNTKLKIGQEIEMPEPTQPDDAWTYPFVGTLVDIVVAFNDGRKTCLIEDQDSDFFDIEIERIEDQGVG